MRWNECHPATWERMCASRLWEDCGLWRQNPFRNMTEKACVSKWTRGYRIYRTSINIHTILKNRVQLSFGSTWKHCGSLQHSCKRIRRRSFAARHTGMAAWPGLLQQRVKPFEATYGERFSARKWHITSLASCPRWRGAGPDLNKCSDSAHLSWFTSESIGWRCRRMCNNRSGSNMKAWGLGKFGAFLLLWYHEVSNVRDSHGCPWIPNLYTCPNENEELIHCWH